MSETQANIADQELPRGSVPFGDDQPDMVNHPSHYADKEIEVIDYIRDTLTPEEFTGYCMGNVLKYCSRWRKKDGAQDLEKAAVYLNWGIESAKAEQRQVKKE